MSTAAKVKEILNAAKAMATNVEVMMMAVKVKTMSTVAKMLVRTPVMMLTAKAREPVPFYRFAEFS